jgi:hypothetical protein
VVAPVLPQLARHFGVSISAATLVITAFAVMRLLAAPPTGFLVQRLGERRIYVSGVLIVAVSTAACAFAHTYWQLLLFRALGGIGTLAWLQGARFTGTLQGTALAGTWAAYVTKAGERYTVETGEVEILPDPAVSGAPLDMRNQARKALDELNAARATWVATGGRVKRYSIAGRDIEYKDAAEIDMEINYWTKQVGEEQTSADLEAGRRPKNRILTRFVRPS